LLADISCQPGANLLRGGRYGPAYRIGFSQCSTQGEWRKAMQAGMERKLVFHPEVELVVRAAKDISVRQLRQARELLRTCSE
jgi:hypothetical protein